jgi:citrate synthase
MGLSFGGERVVFRGKDLLNELRDIRWMDLFLYGITGRRFSENQVRLFEAIWALGTSYPDPRIWNNNVASLAGTARSTGTLALSAALSVSEATLYGRRADIRAMDFLVRAKNKIDRGECLSDVVLSELKKYRSIPGFGRPIVNADERISPVCAVAKMLGYDNGPYLRLAFEVETILSKSHYRTKMNAAALGAALVADQGLSCYEYYLFLTPSFAAGMLPCFIEAANRTEAVFLPLSCERIEYIGVSLRRWTKQSPPL